LPTKSPPEATGARRPQDLAKQRQELAKRHIRRAAASVMALRGFSATIEEIARAAGVSARTVFRYYPTHDQLLAAGVREMLSALGEPIFDLPEPERDLDGWIDRLMLEAHLRNSEVLGRAFWDLSAPDTRTSDELADACGRRRPVRMQWMDYITSRSWAAAGGTGPAPPSLLEVFALLFSAFTTNSLAVDFDHTPEQSAELTASMLKTLLKAAVDRAAG